MRLPLDEAIARAFGAAVVLLVLVVVLLRPGPHHRRPRARPRESAPAAPDGRPRPPPTDHVEHPRRQPREAHVVRRARRPGRRPGRSTGPGARARPGAGRRLRARSPAPARPGARSRSTPGAPTSAPAASSSTSPAPARPTAARSSSRRPSTSPTPRSRSRTRPSRASRPRSPSRDFAYLPIVAGGTSFMYNLTVGGQRVRDLRLSGAHAGRRSSPARSPAGATRRSPRTTARRCRTSRSSRSCAPTAPARRRSSRCTCAARRNDDLLPVHPRQAAPRRQRLPERVLLPGVRQLQGAGRLERRRQLRLRVVRRRLDRVRRVRLRQADRLPGRRPAQQGRLLLAADRGQRRGGADQGEDQLRPDPEPRVGLHQPGPADLPDVELQLHGRPDVDRRAVQRRQGQDAVDVHQLLPVRRASRRPTSSATRRCRRTSCWPASTR